MKISKNKIGISILFLCFYWAGAANASTFTLIGGDPDRVLPGDWNPSNEPSDLSDITVFDAAHEGGVWLNGAADLKYTYIGKEAGSTNASSTSSLDKFFITGDYGGSSATRHDSMIETSQSYAGFLDFSFEGLATCCVLPGIFTNGEGNSGANGGLSLAVAILNPSTLYLMFGDGYGDADFDDMVVKVEAMSAVPVPASIWLFGTALLGFIGISRRTKV